MSDDIDDGIRSLYCIHAFTIRLLIYNDLPHHEVIEVSE